MPRRLASLTDETFTWTSAAPLALHLQVEHEADNLATAMERACRELFPRLAGYRVHEDRLSGAIRGRRYRIWRHGCVGQVSVQLFASGGAYRSDRGNPLQLQVTGRLRLRPPAPRPDFPTEAVPLGAMILFVASLLVVVGGRGWWEVARSPSWSRVIDGLGFVGAATIAVLGSAIVVAMLRRGAALPWAHLRTWLRRPVNHEADRRRWSALRERLAERGGYVVPFGAVGPQQ